MPAIEPLSYAAIDYLRAFDLAAVAVSPSGRVYVCRDPKGASMAWWCKSEYADQIAHVAWTNGDVPGAASRLGLVVTPHAVVVRRVGERVSKIDEAIAAAIDAGVLKQFNAEYRQRRLQAKRDGRHFMPYSQALARLRKVVADAVAKDGRSRDPSLPPFSTRPGLQTGRLALSTFSFTVFRGGEALVGMVYEGAAIHARAWPTYSIPHQHRQHFPHHASVLPISPHGTALRRAMRPRNYCRPAVPA